MWYYIYVRRPPLVSSKAIIDCVLIRPNAPDSLVGGHLQATPVLDILHPESLTAQLVVYVPRSISKFDDLG